MSAAEVQLLEDLRDSEDLARLNAYVNEFNVFEAVGMVRQEIRHSHFLATLLNRQVNHGF